MASCHSVPFPHFMTEYKEENLSESSRSQQQRYPLAENIPLLKLNEEYSAMTERI